MYPESVQPLLQWISAHPTWSGFVVFLISLSESLAIVGLIVPGVVMMTAIGVMMGSGVLPFWETLLWAILGAIAGDGISYWLGYHFHEHLRDFWPFKQFPGLLKRGEKFFKEHGGKSIIFGRFVGPVRPMIPVIAGMMDMTPRRFLVFNIISAIAWAPLYSLPGILIGASLGALSPEAGRKIVLLILILLLALWIIYTFLLKLGIWISRNISKMLAKIWNNWQTSNRLPWLHKTLATAQGTEEGQLGTALLFILSLTFFIGTTINVINSEGVSFWNESVYHAVRALYDDAVVNWVTFLTGLGDFRVLLPTALAIGLSFLWSKRYIAMLCWICTIAIGEMIGFLVQQYVAMPRPDGLIQLSHHFSYPSMHSLTATLVYGLAAAFIQHAVEPPHRWIAWAIAIPLIIIVSLSRVYLGMHWFSDIVGGIMLGTACVTLGILIFRRVEPRHPPLRAILIPGLIVLSLTMTYYCIKIYPKTRMQVVRHWNVQELKTNDWWNDKTDQYELHRTGAFKRIATYFNVQWLSSLTEIKKLLENQGWKPVPPLNFQSSLSFLSNKNNPELFPVTPKFHRDRLPKLVMTKPIDKTKRLVIQLWQSDYMNEHNIPLWVGTLRLETLVAPIPMVSLYQESENENLNNASPNNVDELMFTDLIKDLKETPAFTYIFHPTTMMHPAKILFIRKK